MFIPIGDEPNPHQRPLVTYALIAANVLVFVLILWPLTGRPADLTDPALAEYLRYVAGQTPGVSVRALLAQTAAYDVFTFAHGFKPGAPELSDLFSSLFLHGGWMHLLGNMLFLWIYGDNVEARLGRVGFALLYLGTGVAATLVFSAFQLGSLTPLIGASGAISGVLGTYFLWFPRNRIRVLVVLFVFIDVWRVPARIVLAIYLVVDNLLPFLTGAGAGGGVAYGAHLGGFLAGLGAAAVLGRRIRPAAATGSGAGAWVLDREGQPVMRVAPAESLRATVRQRRFADAAEIYARSTPAERAREDDDDVLDLARGLANLGRSEAALAVLQTFLAGRASSPALPEAHYLAGLVHLHHTGRLPAAREHLLSALDADPAAPLALAAREALQEVEEALRRRREAQPG